MTIVLLALGSLALYLGAQRVVRPTHLDLLIRDGRVLDGSGNPWRRADIGVAGDRIVFLGDSRRMGLEATTTVDASSLTVSPGFIDLHSHREPIDEPARSALALLFQGVTTAVTGNDGGGDWRIDGLASRWEKGGSAINSAWLVGHSAVRREVLGMENRIPTDKEMERMRELVRSAMERGAFGLSTDLYDAPGSYAQRAEITELASEAARYGGYYDTHMRDEGVAVPSFGFLNSVREAIAFGENAQVRVNISHIHPLGAAAQGSAGEAIHLVEAARSRGVEVTADQYPYTASMNSLSAVSLPRWAQAGGKAEARARLSDPGLKLRLEAEMVEMIRGRGGPATIVFAQDAGSLRIAGQTLTAVASKWGVSLFAAVTRVLAAGNPLVISHNQSLADVETFLRQEWVAACTDGFLPVFGDGSPHPRGYGAMVRRLGHFSRERKLISAAFAVRGMTSLPASTLRLPDRGSIREGFAADLVVFDSSRIADRATFEKPHQYAEGIVHVIVNGRFVLRNGQPTGERPGAFLRGPGWVRR